MSKRKPIKKINPVQTIFTRFMLIVAFLVIWIGVIGVRLVHLQVNQYQWLRDRAQNQRRDESKSKSLRGTIFDRADRKLAVSVPVKSLYANPQDIEDVQGTATKIAPLLKLKTQEVFNNISEAKQKGKKFIWLARELEEEAVIKINDNLRTVDLKKADEPKFEGLHWGQEQKRSYPYNSLASQVIGFSDLDDKGISGIELSQEKNLRGEVLKKWQDRDRLGRVYEESENEEREPSKDIVLTISHSIQYKVEEALKNGVESANAKSGMAVVLDPKTGEILAMANYPTFDLNKFNEASAELYTNKAVQNFVTPGSVFKMVTYGSALEEKMISPNEEFDCSKGSLEVAGRVFLDKHCFNRSSYLDAFAVSSNIGAIKTGQKVGKALFYNYAREFGFGEVTGVELPAESKGIIRSPESWNGDSLASMSIGYEIGVTALQSASAFATIANNGVRVKPHIIKEIRQADGQVFSTTEVEKNQVVSAETARQLRQMMQKVVVSGTGKRAQLNGYTSAGKTGTAWKYDEKLKKINENKYVSSFIGMAPVENPSVVIAIILDEPQGGTRDGGHVSAPIFREIAEGILPELNVAPDGFARQEITEDIIEGKEFKSEKNSKTDNKQKVSKATETKQEKPSEKITEKVEKVTSVVNPKMTKDGKVDNPKPKVASTEPKQKSETKNKSSGKGKT
ncbi:MAG: penicillin-binding transpeptidase domain-containing protein [Acidobacteriota bacterium]